MDAARTVAVDLQHYLLIGDVGKTMAGIAGLAGLGFVVAGVILWWPTRRTFVFAVLPKTWQRAGIVLKAIMAAPEHEGGTLSPDLN